MPQPEERRLTAWGLSLAGQYWPGEGMPILALHGWLDNANSFAPMAQHLRNPLFALDFPGHGWSDHRPADAATHYVDYVRDVLAVLDDLGWQRCLLLGHSMGAGVATILAGAFPERLSALALIEGLGPPTTPAHEAPATLRKAITDMYSLSEKQKPVYVEVDDAVQARTRGFGGLSEAAARLLCERGLEQVPGGWTWRADPRLRLTSSLRMTEEQVLGFLGAIDVPTMLISAEQGMGGGGAFAERSKQVAGLRLRSLPGRHHLHMESPVAVAAELEEFVASLADRQGD